MRSVRTKLILLLVGGLTCGIIVTLWVTYGAVRTQIGRVFDNEMQQVAQAVHVQEDWIELGRVRIARPGFSFAVRAYDITGRTYFETVLPAVPSDVSQTFVQGYYFFDTSSGRWRIYTYVVPEGIVQVGQPVATRDALARDLSLRVILPLLLLIPVVAIVVMWGLKRGLAPLAETTKRVAERDAMLLDPLPTASVPEELLPLVEQINALLARLSRTLEGQRHFLADVAHELRTPMAALALQAQVAERAPTPSERQVACAELRLGIERASRLVQQLLDYARLEPGVDREPDERVDLARLVREIVGTHAVRADGMGVDLGADAPGACYVVGNESQLRSLIGNLIDNGLRYTPRDSAVTVSVRLAHGRVELQVVDGGPGIPAVERERVFQRFHRVPGDRTPGNGLGLSIVKAIVQRHHGTLVLGDAVSGAQYPGLRVLIGLPLATPAASASENDMMSSKAA